MFKSIADTFSNCFKIPELKSRILFTLMLLAVCRIVAWVPVPGLDGTALKEWFDHNQSATGGVVGLYSMFTGGAIQKCAVGALGIMPYITATIIIQLLTTVVGSLQKLAREEGGRAQIVKYGRYLTVLLCLGQGIFMTLGWENPSVAFPGFVGDLVFPGMNLWWYRIQTVVILTTGTLLLMWLGEQITERGIGNGISLVITIGIVADLPMAAQGFFEMFFPGGDVEGRYNPFVLVFLVALLVIVVGGVVAVTQAQRKIPVQYAQRAVGRKIFQGGSSFMPLRVNAAGVMPIIFAQAILMFPAMLLIWAGQRLNMKAIETAGHELERGHWTYYALYTAMILFFSYFWIATQFNEIQIADDLKKHGGYIPGVRPGQATSDFLHRAMSRITLAGAIFLTVIAVIPMLMGQIFKINFNVSQFFGGTSMLITVGVLLDTMRQMESHLLMRHYDGFLKKGKLKGR